MKEKKAKKEKVKKIQFFSQETNRLYQLFPTKTAPTLKISGVPMHRHTHIDPLEDTRTKVAALKPRGKVLDTCTGLGYTAIYSAKLTEVEKVITIEKDANVAEIAKMNEFSNELFINSKIDRRLADSAEEIKTFKNEEFDSIIHDPPTFKISPELYNKRFYVQIYRVLKHGGKIWHYCPAPGKLKGEETKLRMKIINGLRNTGFTNIKYDSASSGITAEKP